MKTQSLMTQQELAALLGVSVRTLRRYRKKRLVPEPVRFERQVRWDPSVIDRWLKSRTAED